MTRLVAMADCLVLFLAACGGSSSSPDNGLPLSGDALAAACEATCAHAVSCGWQTDTVMCEASCTDDAPLFRGSGFEAWMACVAQGECAAGSPGEACYVSTAAATDPRDVHEDYVAQCQAVATTCPTAVLPSGVCDIDQVILFSDLYMTGAVLPCFEQACDLISACLEAAVLDAF